MHSCTFSIWPDTLAKLNNNDTQKCHKLILEPCMVIPLKVSIHKASGKCWGRPQISAVKNFILHGFPSHHSQLPELYKQFWQIHRYLLWDVDLIVYGCRLLILPKLCSQILSNHNYKSPTKAQREQICIPARSRHWYKLACQTYKDCQPFNVRNCLSKNWDQMEHFEKLPLILVHMLVDTTLS